VGQIHFLEAIHYLSDIYITEKLNFLFLKRLEVVPTIIYDGRDQISLYVLDLLRTKCKPFQEGLLHDVFRIFPAPN
jgi:hypothetical protein